MSAYFRGQAIAMLGIAVLVIASCVRGAITQATTLPATATVTTIDRHCTWINKSDGSKHEDSCGDRDDFRADVYANGKRTKSLEGRAVVHLAYTAPQNSSYQTGQFDIDGSDDQFYELSAGDPVKIRVDKDNPASFTLD